MRIAVDARPLRFPHTGIGKYTAKLLVHLKTKPDTELCLYGLPGRHAEHPEWRRSRTRAISSRKVLATVEALLLMGQWARLDKADLFWSPRHHLPINLSGMPAVTTIHDLVWLRQPQTMPTMNLLSERLLMPRSISRSTRIIVPSEYTRADVQRTFPDCAALTRVTPLGGDLCFPSPMPSLDRDFALFIGGTQPRKNLKTVVAALGHLRRQGTIVNLVVVGASPAASHPLKTLIEVEQVEEQIVFRGGVSEADLAALYRDCRFLIAPYLWEGFGLPVAEAAHFGKPAIVTADSALAEVAGNAGLQVRPERIEEVAHAIDRLLSDPQAYDRLSRAALQISQQYIWSQTATRTLEIFEKSLQDG